MAGRKTIPTRVHPLPLKKLKNRCPEKKNDISNEQPDELLSAKPIPIFGILSIQLVDKNTHNSHACIWKNPITASYIDAEHKLKHITHVKDNDC